MFAPCPLDFGEDLGHQLTGLVEPPDVEVMLKISKLIGDHATPATPFPRISPENLTWGRDALPVFPLKNLDKPAQTDIG